MTDNDPQFVTEEFASFVKANGIKHIKSAPYHPSTNGAIERLVQTFKKAMKASEHDGRTHSQRLASFLLSYRTTPHTTTKEMLSELFLKRKLRTRLDLLKPDVNKSVSVEQANRRTIMTVEVVNILLDKMSRHIISGQGHIGWQV